ncbi:MAG: Fe-S cluster assembly protein SufD [Rhodospirillales bacterium]|nr:Fe-S cluster assembly protein SufD [Rhodospirillales bacterium]
MNATAFLARFDNATIASPEARAAASVLREHGLPGMREEAWRATPLRGLYEADLDAPAAPVLPPVLAAFPAPRLVFADGRFAPALSAATDRMHVATGVAMLGLARPATDKLVALNTMLATDGATVEVAAGTDAGTLLLAHLATGATSHPRHAIRLGAGAKLTLVDYAGGQGAYFHNPVLEVALAPGATLTHLRIQDESEKSYHLATIYAEAAEGATYDSFLLARGAAIGRTEIHARLAGPRATAHLNAAQLLARSQHGDFTTVVRHDAPATISRQTVKTVLAGRAHGVFQGKIEVAPEGQKTDGYQMNQTLLLSPRAEISAKPQLEIYADDVKCSHGATVGELDAEQLFYLRSRGIPEAAARAILVRAFLAEALDPIAHEAARAWMETLIDPWWDNAR